MDLIASALGRKPELVLEQGRAVPEPLDVRAGMVSCFRPSVLVGRVKWPNLANWNRVARVFPYRAAGRVARKPRLPCIPHGTASPIEKVCEDSCLSCLKQIVKPDVHNLAYGNLPVQLDRSSRAWAVNSLAQLLAHGGELSGGVVQQSGRRMPRLDGLKTALHSV